MKLVFSLLVLPVALGDQTAGSGSNLGKYIYFSWMTMGLQLKKKVLNIAISWKECLINGNKLLLSTKLLYIFKKNPSLVDFQRAHLFKEDRNRRGVSEKSECCVDNVIWIVCSILRELRIAEVENCGS